MNRIERIEQLLIAELAPSYLQIADESKNHHVPKDAQTHFKVIAVSSKFTQLSRIARHRVINHLLEDEFTSGLHALSLHLYTAEEWQVHSESVLGSPLCKDGYNNNAG